MESAFPPGTYRYTLNSPQLTPVTAESAQIEAPIEGRVFPNVPYFTNFGAIQNMDSRTRFTFKWNQIAALSPPVGSQLFFVIRDIVAGTGTVNAFIPDSTVTSYSVPVNTLRPARRYAATILFDYRNPAAGVGFAGAASYLSYESGTSMTFTTEPLPTDFDSDDHPDYLLFNANTMQTAIWYLNGPSFVSAANGPTLPADWSVVSAADFNGDGKPDLLLFHASDLRTYVWYMNGPSAFGSAPGPTLPAGWSLIAH